MAAKQQTWLRRLQIIALVMLILYFTNQLFHDQLSVLFGAINAILLPFGIALFLSYLLSPIIQFIETRFKIQNRIVSIVLVFILLLVFLVLFVLVIGNIIYTQAELFILVDWTNIVTQVETFVANNPSLQDLYDIIKEYASMDTVAPYVFDVLSIFKGIIGFVVAIVLVPVFLVFLLNDKDTIFKGILWVFPKQMQKDLVALAKRANEVTEKYFNGRFISMFIMSVFFTIVFLVLGFGVDRAIFFGFTLGFLDIIPYIGGFIGVVLPILYSFTITDQTLLHEWTFVAIIIINAIAQFIQGNILQPYIMGKEVKLHPLLILSSFIFFGALFGITGVILAIPITGTLKATLEYYREAKLDG
jgi:putative permease